MLMTIDHILWAISGEKYQYSNLPTANIVQDPLLKVN